MLVAFIPEVNVAAPSLAMVNLVENDEPAFETITRPRQHQCMQS